MKQLLFKNLSQDEITAKLLEIADKKLLVKRTVYKYKNHHFFSSIFNEEDVTSDMYDTVFKTLRIFQRYNATQLMMGQKESLLKSLKKSEISKVEEMVGLVNQATKWVNPYASEYFSNNEESEEPSTSSENYFTDESLMQQASEIMSQLESNKTIKKVLNKPFTMDDLVNIWRADTGSLDLSTEAYLTGYLVRAFTNNISKKYSSYKNTDKRSMTEMIYLDSFIDKNSEVAGNVKNKLEAHTSIDPNEERTYSKTLTQMALYLRSYDKRQNQINQNQKSQLTKLFCSIVNPKKVETSQELRERFGWSQYLLNKNKDLLMEKIREEFSDSKEDILTFLDSREQKNRAS